MSNHLSMSNQQAIIGLIERGWSQHRVARELDLDRKTVRRHVRLNQAAKSPISTAGSAEPNSPISTAGSGLGRKSHCEAVAVNDAIKPLEVDHIDFVHEPTEATP